MAIGDKIAIADKPTLDVVSANVGSNADTANATGSAHAKLKDIKTFVNGINNKVGQDEEPASPTGSVHAKLKDIKANLGSGGGVTDADGIKYVPVVSKVPRALYVGEAGSPSRAYVRVKTIVSDNDYFYVIFINGVGIQKYSKKTLKLVASAASGINFGGLAIKDGFLYASYGTAVRKYDKNTFQLVATSDALVATGSKLIIDGDRIYVMISNGSASRIQALSLLNLSIVYTSGTIGVNLSSMALNSNYLYVGSNSTTVYVHLKSNLSYVGVVTLSGGAGSNIPAIVANDEYAFPYSNNGTAIHALLGTTNSAGSLYSSPTINTIVDLALNNDEIIAVGASTAHPIVRLRANDLRITEIITAQDTLTRRENSCVYVDDDFIYVGTQEGTIQIYSNGYEVIHYKKGV